MNSPNVSDSSSTPASSTSTITGKVQDLKAAAAEKTQQLKEVASSTVSRAKTETARIASDKKAAAADRIGGYSSVVHDTAKSLEEKDPNIAWFTHRAADRIEQVADYIRTRDLQDVRTDLEEVARRHPAAFFGGLFVAGLLVGNLVKASRRKDPEFEGLGDFEGERTDWPASETSNVPESASAPTGGI